MGEDSGTQKIKKEQLKLPEKPAVSDDPFSEEQIGALNDLISEDSSPDEDTGTYRLPTRDE
jgi:hypothetical protein